MAKNKIKTKTKVQLDIGLNIVVFVVFLIGKLLGWITWSWWWITSPLWIGLIEFFVIGTILLLTFQRK